MMIITMMITTMMGLTKKGELEEVVLMEVKICLNKLGRRLKWRIRERRISWTRRNMSRKLFIRCSTLLRM
jgi:hypothetical protein